MAHIRELDELVLELLSYSRLQNPAQLPERVDVVLSEFIDSVLGSVDDELENPEIVIDVVLDCAVERFNLDPRLTARALQNLLRNATRYCDARIQVGVKVCPQGCEIWVDDDGIGIRLDQRERYLRTVLPSRPQSRPQHRRVWPGPGHQPPCPASPGRDLDRAGVTAGRCTVPGVVADGSRLENRCAKARTVPPFCPKRLAMTAMHASAQAGTHVQSGFSLPDSSLVLPSTDVKGIKSDHIGISRYKKNRYPAARIL